MDQTVHIAQGLDAVGTTEAAQQTAALPATSILGIVGSHAGLMALEPQWRDLQANSQSATVFQSFEWVSSWSQVYIRDHNTAELHILTGYDRNKLVFVWPLMLVNKRGVRTLTWLTDPMGQYGDVLCAKGHSASLWISNSLLYLRRLKGFDLLRLRHVRKDSTLTTTAAHQLCDARLNERAPALDLTAFATEADYDNRYTGAQRKRRKKIRKSLEDMGTVAFNTIPPGSTADTAMASAIEEKNKWLAERGRLNRVLKCEGHMQFLRLLSRTGLETVVTELKAGDMPVSWEIGFRVNGCHYAYITSHVNALTDLSPGRLHMDLSQRACLAAGMKSFDLMLPYDAHKESWSSGTMATADYYLPFTKRGALAGHVYVRTVRPLLRSIYYRLPEWALKLINR